MYKYRRMRFTRLWGNETKKKKTRARGPLSIVLINDKSPRRFLLFFFFLFLNRKGKPRFLLFLHAFAAALGMRVCTAAAAELHPADVGGSQNLSGIGARNVSKLI